MRLTEILQPESIIVPLKATGKRAAIDELVDKLCEVVGITARDVLKEAVWQREATRTTGIGHGIAIPHGKCCGCTKLAMAMAKPVQPIDFGSIDGKPVDLILLLTSPQDQTGPHIQALASISRLLTEDTARAAFRTANTAKELYDLVVQHDNGRAS